LATYKLLSSNIPNVPPKQDTRGKRSGGRPAKYAEPSRPVTITLPETTLRGLQNIDPDRGRAIVKLTKTALGKAGNGPPLVEIVEMAANTALVVIGPSTYVKQIPFVRLVEIAPVRYVLAIEPGYDFASLEIALSDLLEVVPDDEPRERELIAQLLAHVKNLRKTERLSLAQILFVKLDGNSNGRG
jgi:hypothetical protein